MYGRIAISQLTHAMQAKELLGRAQIESRVVRLRPGESPGGCAYGLELSGQEMVRAGAVLSRAGIRFTMI